MDTNRRWPDVLAERLQQGADGKTEVGVLNQGIIGNRLLNDSPRQAGSPFGAALGQAGLARFERDVLAQAGIRYVIVGLGINDIAFPGALTPLTDKDECREHDIRLSSAHKACPSKGNSGHWDDEPTVRERVLGPFKNCAPGHLL